MRHGREDLDRMQDPAANPALLEAYDAAMNLVAHRAENAVTLYRALDRLTAALSPTLGLCIGPNAIPMGKPIGVDEPVFLLRATDRHAPGTVQHWIERNYNRGRGNEDVIDGARQQRDRMLAWQERHADLVHVADLPADVCSKSSTSAEAV